MSKKIARHSVKVFYIKVKVDKYDLTNSEFRSLTIIEKLHNSIPLGRLEINCTPEILQHFITIGSKVEIEWKYQDFTEKLEFMNIGFDFKQETNSEYHISIDLALNVPDYFQKSFAQKSFPKKTFKDVIATIKTVKPKIEIKGNTNDKQTWIRPNYTDKNFVDYLYDYCYLKNDLILLALNRKKELVINNFKNIKSKKPLKISNMKKEDIRYSSYSFSKQPSVLDYKLSPLRKVRIFRLPIHKIDVLDISPNSIFTEKVYDQLKPYNDFKIKVDNMNTYPEYLFSNRTNQVKRKRLEFFKLNLTLEKTMFYKIELLDYVEFKEKTFRSHRMQTVLAGNYIVGEKSFTITKNGLTEHNVVLYRDYFIEG